MPVTCILGTQWGDEAKAKVVDSHAAESDVVVRFQGGANAGHTVVVGDRKYVFHMVPTGIIREDVVCIVANGVVFDYEAFFEEIDALRPDVGDVRDRLYVSDRAHVVMPYHKALDRAREAKAADGKIGTTARGIGPAYADKMNRTTAIRVGDLADRTTLEKKAEAICVEKNAQLSSLGSDERVSEVEIVEEALELGKRLAPYVADTVHMLHDYVSKGKRVLLEGAQAAMLDVDFGTYPFVTSSNTTIGAASTGTGIPPMKIGRIIGITKAYTTRVGAGPFPTEETGETGERLRESGREYGATTGRPRRCGWLDLVALRHSYAINGISEIALTKFDVLSGFDEVKAATAYEIEGLGTVTEFPADVRALEKARPVFRTFPGWKEPVGKAKALTELPQAAREYVSFIEKETGVAVGLISTGPERSQIIQMGWEGAE